MRLRSRSSRLSATIGAAERKSLDRRVDRTAWSEPAAEQDVFVHLELSGGPCSGLIEERSPVPASRAFHAPEGQVKGPGRGDWRSLLDQTAAGASGEFQVNEYVLFSSRLGPGGAIYTPIERFALGRADRGGETR